MLWLMNLAQAVDPLSGGAGWLGAGLLGLVLGWLLLIHLPAKDKQLKDFLDTKDKHIDIITERFVRSMEIKDQASAAAAAAHKAAFDSAIKFWREEMQQAFRSRREEMQAIVKAMKEEDN